MELRPDLQSLRQLFDDYVRMYASRDDQLTTRFSEDFSGFTGGGHNLVKDRAEWVAITRQDFAQVRDAIRIELKDVAIQSLTETISVATGFFTIHLPIKDHILSRETARLVLIFRKESADWKIAHSSISIPYHLVREGEVYPLKELVDRNQALELQVADRTAQLSEANANLLKANELLEREIAKHQLAADALQRSEERYRSILNASPDDITITDREGRIIMVSPAAFKVFGPQRTEEFVGRMITDYIIPADRARAMAQVALRLQGVKSGPSEYRGLRPDGSTFDIEVNTEFIRDAQGAPSGMVLISRDITERKRAEAQRDELEAQSRKLQKAESLGRMASAIAHHFNNQLQGVMGNLELALSDLSETGGPVDSLTAAMDSARNATEMSSLMLTYLGLTITRREPLDISSVCTQTLQLLRSVLPRSAVFETNLPFPGPAIHADPNQIQQVLTNLVTNALEASSDGRKVVRLTVSTVSGRALPARNRFPIDFQPLDTTYACLEVADRGCGMGEDEMEQIFDPFFSTKFQGRGMGLAVVLGIARTLDGVITVESEPDKGSTFRVFLPVSEKSSPATRSEFSAPARESVRNPPYVAS